MSLTGGGRGRTTLLTTLEQLAIDKVRDTRSTFNSFLSCLTVITIHFFFQVPSVSIFGFEGGIETNRQLLTPMKNAATASLPSPLETARKRLFSPSPIPEVYSVDGK